MKTENKSHPLLEEAVKDFELRYKPYDIQIDFMNDMLKCYDEGKIGFFESPTGTGKSSSVICSSVAYLKSKNAAFFNKKRRHDSSDSDDTDSDSSDLDFNDSIFDENKPKPSNLIIATRTHSQIKEMINEFKSLLLAAKKVRSNAHQQIIELETKARSGQKDLFDEIQNQKQQIRTINQYIDSFPRCVSLASRKQLCVNSEFKNLSQSELNEKCSSQCPFYNNGDFKQFRKTIRDKPMDIEDLCRYGESYQMCPYYASRDSISHSDVILLPYQTLFQQSTRENIDLKIDNSYIVVDEAHNLVDALNCLYTVSISSSDIDCACDKMLAYRAKIARPPKNDKILSDSTQNRRKEDIGNISALYQVLSLIRKSFSNENPGAKKVMSMNEFQITFKIKVGNTFSLSNWAKESKIVYNCCHSEKDEKTRITSSESFRKCLSFVEMMGNTDDMGTVVISNDQNQLTYLLLNPSNVFMEVANQAKSVVLVGGTLQPLEDVVFQLTQDSCIDRIMTHCNGHVIPKESCLCMCALKGPKDSETLFNYERRETPTAIDSICLSVVDLAEKVPHGIIVFFSSRSFMMKVYNYISKTKEEYERRINDSNKFLLCEPVEESQLTKVMKTFKSHIDHDPNQGAVLFAVINGKLSEGINFANDYCRCVVVVGMPYPDSKDIVLQQRREFFNQKALEGKTKCNGQMFYENLCMRAVNQSIGRSFRNINDYAVVVLLDCRYKDHAKNLPTWIQRSYRNVPNWDLILRYTETFFKSKA